MITVKKGKHNKAFQFLQHRDETFVMLIIILYLLIHLKLGRRIHKTFRVRPNLDKVPSNTSDFERVMDMSTYQNNSNFCSISLKTLLSIGLNLVKD